MPLIQCPECGKPVSDQAVSCPACGYLLGGVVPVEPIRRPWAGTGIEGEILSLMAAAGFLLGLGMMTFLVPMLVGFSAVFAVLLIILKVRRRRWPLAQAILYVLFFAALGFGLGYGIEWYLMHYLASKPLRFGLPVPSPIPTGTAWTHPGPSWLFPPPSATAALPAGSSSRETR
jgi:hypothetical protein